MICNRCDPAGYIGGEEKQFLEREYAAREVELRKVVERLVSFLDGKEPLNHFHGERIARLTADMDAIRNLQIVVM